MAGCRRIHKITVDPALIRNVPMHLAMNAAKALPWPINLDRPDLCDSFLMDPNAPVMAEFLREEMLRGTLCTIPLGGGRVMVCPTWEWSRNRAV
jgi:hypothetical protein